MIFIILHVYDIPYFHFRKNFLISILLIFIFLIWKWWNTLRYSLSYLLSFFKFERYEIPYIISDKNAENIDAPTPSRYVHWRCATFFVHALFPRAPLSA